MDRLNLEKLLLEIEALRSYLNELISQNDLQNPKVLEVSRQLDELLSKYYEIIKDRR